MSKYTPTIGIETHVQLKTKTKLFSAVSNDAREASPNTLISHICVGMPGALPVLNEKALELATRAAFALNTKPEKFSKFDRKHYFYPDLPKGYQISQYEDPIIKGGYVEIWVGDELKKIGITRAHLEEDAGKNTHPTGADYSLVDLNRAGTPLLEIVSEPDIHSAADGKAFVRELYLLMKYADVSDVDLYHGNMRFDVNISISKDPEKLGTRSEIKNLNSFKSVEAAIEYEIKRQTELLEAGKEVVQETRGWDEAKQKTTGQRGKEEAHDYRYMPEPDIPPVELDEGFFSGVEKEMPALPAEWRKKLSRAELTLPQIDTLLEAEVERSDFTYLSYLERRLDDPEEVKFVANWYINTLIPIVREEKFKFEEKYLSLVSNIFELVKGEKLNSNNAKVLYDELLHKDIGNWPEAIEKYAEQRGFIQVSDESVIEKIVDEVLAENPKAVADVKAGEAKAIGFLVGQVMAKSKGQANPGLAQKIIKNKTGL